jgi:hypothetical protein
MDKKIVGKQKLEPDLIVDLMKENEKLKTEIAKLKQKTEEQKIELKRKQLKIENQAMTFKEQHSKLQAQNEALKEEMLKDKIPETPVSIMKLFGPKPDEHK